MSTESSETTKVLAKVLDHLNQNHFAHVPTPEGCKRRASVALIIRVRPAYTPLSRNNGSVVSLEKPEHTYTSINEFFADSWVQEGDPEVLFIKRAGRAGDRWSGHVALPGGKRDPEDADDMSAAVRETLEEIGLDLNTSQCLPAGNLPQRIVATTWGKAPLMVLCPYVFLLTSKTIPPLLPQPTEVAAIHWVPLRALLSPTLRTKEFVDVSSRLATQGGPLLRKILLNVMGKMEFSAINLLPAESVYATSLPGFIPETRKKPTIATKWAQQYGVPDSSKSLSFHQPIVLWGLTLGVMADFLDMLPPYNAVRLWRYPTFTPPDLRFLVYLFTFRLRQNNAGDLSAGTWPSQTAVDATTQATAVPEAPANKSAHNNVGMGGLGVGKDPKYAVGRLLSGYYERTNVAIAVFLAYRALLGVGAAYWLYRVWQRRRAKILKVSAFCIAASIKMRWTTEEELVLLLSVLAQTSSFTVDSDLVVKHWPKDVEKPTARAVRDRITKIKKDAKKNGVANASRNGFYWQSTVGRKAKIDVQKNDNEQEDSEAEPAELDHVTKQPQTPSNKKTAGLKLPGSPAKATTSSKKDLKRKLVMDSDEEEEEAILTDDEVAGEASSTITSHDDPTSPLQNHTPRRSNRARRSKPQNYDAAEESDAGEMSIPGKAQNGKKMFHSVGMHDDDSDDAYDYEADRSPQNSPIPTLKRQNPYAVDREMDDFMITGEI